LTAEGAAPIGLRAAADMQHDQVVGIDINFVPALLRLAQADGPLRPEAKEIAQLLGRWDGDLAPSSRGGVAYEMLMDRLVANLVREPLGDALFDRYDALPGARPAAIVRQLVMAADGGGAEGGWSDPGRVRSAIRASLRETWVSLSYRLGPAREGWAWGGLHDAVFAPFSQVGSQPGSAIAEIGQTAKPYGIGGDETTLGAAIFPRTTRFQASAAATYRMAVDLAAVDRMLSILAPGQSEHPGHPFATDGVARWLGGRPSLLLTSRLLVEEESGARLLLEPAK
jgi:acyl-homoserine lactone acylase PvdQ